MLAQSSSFIHMIKSLENKLDLQDHLHDMNVMYFESFLNTCIKKLCNDEIDP